MLIVEHKMFLIVNSGNKWNGHCHYFRLKRNYWNINHL